MLSRKIKKKINSQKNDVNPASEEIKKPSYRFCPIYAKKCDFPLSIPHLSCINCFGRLAKKAKVLEKRR